MGKEAIPIWVILYAIFVPCWNEYRRGVYENIAYRTPFPDTAARSTYSEWKQRLIFFVAKEMNLA